MHPTIYDTTIFSLTRLLVLFAALVPICGCEKPHEEAHHEHHKILVTCPMVKDVINTQQYVVSVHQHQ
jgi:hypothetical protein